MPTNIRDFRIPWYIYDKNFANIAESYITKSLVLSNNLKNILGHVSYFPIEHKGFEECGIILYSAHQNAYNVWVPSEQYNTCHTRYSTML